MRAQVHSFPRQTEARSKVFLEWKSIDLSLTCGGNVNYYESIHQPIPTRENRKNHCNFQNFQFSIFNKFCFQSSSAILLSKMKSPFFQHVHENF